MDKDRSLIAFAYGVLLAMLTMFMASIDFPSLNIGAAFLPMFIVVMLALTISTFTALGTGGIMLFVIKQMDKISDKLAGVEWNLFDETMSEIIGGKTPGAYVKAILGNLLQISMWTTIAILAGVHLSPNINQISSILAFLGSMFGMSLGYAAFISVSDTGLSVARALMEDSQKAKRKEKMSKSTMLEEDKVNTSIDVQLDDMIEEWTVTHEDGSKFITTDRAELLNYTLDMFVEEKRLHS